MALKLDEKEVSPSDFALVVRNVPKDMNKDQLIKLVEDRY
jgi:hypothetical protein